MTNEHGPARRLVERAILSQVETFYKTWDEQVTELHEVRIAADAHDAAHAALVEAAETLYNLVDRGTEFDWHEKHFTAMSQLRAALDVARRE